MYATKNELKARAFVTTSLPATNMYQVRPSYCIPPGQRTDYISGLKVSTAVVLTAVYYGTPYRNRTLVTDGTDRYAARIK